MSDNMQPIFIMPEDSKRTTGKDAQQSNIEAAKAVAQTLRSTLGPKGMDKMLVDEAGDVIVTNDGVTILQEMKVEHPAAKMIIEIAKTQEQEVGDGTTTAVVLAGELLKEAQQLLEQNIHPTVITKGYDLALRQAQQLLESKAQSIDPSSRDILDKIGATAMTGKAAANDRVHLATLLVDACLQVRSDSQLDVNAIKVETLVGEQAAQSELISGIVLDKERVHSGMPVKKEHAKIALLNCPLEIRNTEIDAKIQITSPSQLTQFLQQEEASLRSMVETIASSGASVVFCQKGIDDLAQHFFAKRGIIAARRVKRSDMQKLRLATGATIVSSVSELSVDSLGSAGIVEEKQHASEGMLYVQNCPNPKAVTLLIKGASSHIAAENKRAIDDALGDVRAALSNGKIVAGAGAIEMHLSSNLRNFAKTLSGKEQLAVHAFASALEVIPTTLAQNAGLDCIDILTGLRQAHQQSSCWMGVNVSNGLLMDAWQEGVLEPMKVKSQALACATQVAQLILRIDDVILRSPKQSSGSSGPML